MSLYDELVKEAAFFVGVSEQDGKPNAGPNIEAFLASVGLSSGQPWCAAFVSFCLGRVAERQGTHPWCPYTGHVLTMWRDTPEAYRHKEPKPGYLMVWQMNKTLSGHIGIVESVSEDGRQVFTIEGNTSNAEYIAREGDGVWRKGRPVRNIGGMVLLGFLDPWGEKS